MNLFSNSEITLMQVARLGGNIANNRILFDFVLAVCSGLVRGICKLAKCFPSRHFHSHMV